MYPLRNIRLTIEYDGTRFCGWQQQAKGKKHSIQGELEKALKSLFGKKVRLIGSGRTDSGVHAEAQVANFKIQSSLPIANIKKGLNSYLPQDIAILSAEEAPLNFHSRYDAKEKLYRYTILNRSTRSPLLRRYSTRVSCKLGIEAMKKAAKYFIGRKDFKSFQASDKKEKSSIRAVRRLDIIEKSRVIVEIYIQADGFLYNMARNITGTLIDVGRGRIRPEAVRDILSKKHRPSAGHTAPAKGLCLVKVFF